MNNPIAREWQTHVEELYRYFNDFSNGTCLLWVCPAQADPFKNDETLAARRIRVPIDHPRFDASMAPYLVMLNLSRSPDADLFRSSVEIAWQAWSMENLESMGGQAIAGWVDASVQADLVALHWGMLCHLHRRGNLSKLLRFHDPSVREWLWPTLSTAQKRALLGPVNALFSIGRERTLINQRTLPGTERTSSAAAQSYGPFTLTEQQWSEVEDYAAIHAAWVECSCSWVRTSDNWHRQVLNALANATKYGLIDARDRQLFAQHAFQIGPNFYSLAKMKPVWERTLSGECYGRAVEDVFSYPADRLQSLLTMS